MNDSKYGRLYPERAVAPLVEVVEGIIGDITGRPSTENERALMEALETLNDEGFPPDEPLFLLRGQDELAPCAVKHYAEDIRLSKMGEPMRAEMRKHVLAFADRMAAWQPRKLPD